MSLPEDSITLLALVLAAALALPVLRALLERALAPRFEARPLLNRSELRLRKIVCRHVPPDHMVFAKCPTGRCSRTAHASGS